MQELRAKISDTKAKIIIVTEVIPKNCQYKPSNAELKIFNCSQMFMMIQKEKYVYMFIHH